MKVSLSIKENNKIPKCNALNVWTYDTRLACWNHNYDTIWKKAKEYDRMKPGGCVKNLTASLKFFAELKTRFVMQLFIGLRQ